MHKIINTILISLTGVVAIIFVVGIFNKYSTQIQLTDLSSMNDINSDQLTNKYIKELQSKLKQDEKASLKQIKKALEYKAAEKPKDDDWRKVPVEQQITRDSDVSRSTELHTRDRSAAGTSFGGTIINKDNATDFIATARKNGYHVVLSADYEVISITPIMNMQNVDETFETNLAQ